MYKSTRHSNPMWTYSPGAIGQYAAVSEDEVLKLVEECRSALLGAGLLDAPDLLNLLAGYGPLGYVSIINGRIRGGHSYLKKIGIPQALVATLPRYFLIAPKLGKVLARLSAARRDGLPHGLAGIHQHIARYGAPSTRPKLSRAAYRVEKSTLSNPSGHAGTHTLRSVTSEFEQGQRLPDTNADVAAQAPKISTPASVKADASPGQMKRNAAVK